MSTILQSFAIGTIGLQVILVVAIICAFSRTPPNKSQLTSLRPLFVTAIGCQLVHLSEESYYGFNQRLPELLGLAPWPMAIFLGFNLSWVMLWLLSIYLPTPNRASATALWFLAIASAFNAIAHPGLSIAVGGYFPGLVTSPLVGLMGVILIRKLTQARL